MSQSVALIVNAPVVSSNTNSIESKLARQAKYIEEQALADTKYDTIIERFMNPVPIEQPLLIVAIALGLLAYGVLAYK